MKVAYYLNEGRKKNLYCRISDGKEKVTFSIGHRIEPNEWNLKNDEGSSEDEYYFTLNDFKSYLTKRFNELKAEGKSDILEILKNESISIIEGEGIIGIARNMFDQQNQMANLPKYDDFITAFEKFSNLTRKDYQAQAIGYVFHFTTDNKKYEIDTYEGKIAFLQSVIDRKSYDEIYTMTNENIWSDIYVDAGIEKHIFLSVMVREWEEYWDNKYADLKERGRTTDHLDKKKEFSWKQFQIFMSCYDNCGDAIALASEIEDFELYPIAVITMMNIFDAETCYLEYCEFEFNEDWESIEIRDDNNSPIFYIKEIDS